MLPSTFVGGFFRGITMLKISKNSALTDIVSTDGSNPLTTTHPTTGSTVTTQVWLFNDDSTKTYKSISIDPTDSVSTDESTWVQLSADNVTYQSAGAVLNMADITDTTGHSFWVKVVAPAVASSQNKTDIKLTVNAQEYAV